VTRAALSLLVVLGVLAGGVAMAQPAAPDRTAPDPAAADRAAAEANALARDGKFVEAAAKFREAWRADRLRPELFCNIGIVYYKAKDLVRAHLLLGQCLEQAALDPKFVDAARTALASVEAVLRGGRHAPVRIVVEPPASAVAIAELDPDGSFLGSRVVWLPLGSHRIAARAEGYVDAEEVVTTKSPEPTTVRIELHRTAPIVAPPPPVVPPPPPPSRLPAYVATGVAAVALGVATVAFFEGHARADLGATALDPDTREADRQSVSSWNTTMGIAGAVAIAGAAASGYLWYRALHGAQVEVHAGPNGAGVSLIGRF
jgi:hypothetical protein